MKVEWAGHPNWFFRLSKFSLPYLKHPAAPATRFLSDVEHLDQPQRYVLKPLYSFAGLGVVVGPTAEQIAARPSEYLVQLDFWHLPELVDLNAVVTNLEKMLRRVIGEDIDLITETGVALAPIRA